MTSKAVSGPLRLYGSYRGFHTCTWSPRTRTIKTRSIMANPIPATISHTRYCLQQQTRSISAYGYIQSKSLVYEDYGNPQDVLSLHKYSISPPHGSLVTVKALAAPLNPADINQIQGVYPAKPSFTTLLGTPKPAAVPGNEGVFEVIATGSGVPKTGPGSLQKGDWVIPAHTGLGTWRTHLQVDAQHLFKMNKEGLTIAQAATVTVNPVTAWRMLTDFVGLDAHRNDWFILNGANSGVGRAALQLGKRNGWRSIAIIRGDGRPEQELAKLREDLLALGATRVATEEEAQDRGFGAQVKEWTNGGRERVRLALNCVGGRSATAMAKVLASGAHVVTYGAMSKQPMMVAAGPLIFKDLVWQGFWVSKWGDRHPEEKRKTIEAVLDLYRAGAFRDVPYDEIDWRSGSSNSTSQETLTAGVQATLDGYRKGKGIFMFADAAAAAS